MSSITINYMLGLMMGLTVGMLVGDLLVRDRTRVQQRTHDIEWVETCWPNKPVWTEGPGVCWVNGQKVVVE